MMSAPSRPSTQKTTRKRNQLETTSIPSDGISTSDFTALSHAAGFPTSFHLPSRRCIRRRLLATPAGFPHPDPITAAQSRRKRKLAMATKLNREISGATEMMAHTIHLQGLQRCVRQRITPSQPSTLLHDNAGHTEPSTSVNGALSSSISSVLLSPSKHQYQ